MKPAPIYASDEARLAALGRHEILDTPAESAFDDFTKLASFICATPIALISLVDAERQWFKSKVGIEATETPRDISFCGHAIHGLDVFEVPNALDDERFSDNPLVTGAPNIRFYAGAPLVTPDGHGIGTLCVIDSVPRKLSNEQRDALAALGRHVVRQLEQRRSEKMLRYHDAIVQSSDDAIISKTLNGSVTSWNPAAEKIYGYLATEVIGKSIEMLIPPDRLNEEAYILNKVANGEILSHFETVRRRKDGSLIDILATISPVRDSNGKIIGISKSARDISDRKRAEIKIQDQLQHTQAILDNVMDGIITIDERGSVASLNLAAERIFGYGPAEVLGQNVKMLMPEPYHSEHDGYLNSYRATGVERVIGIGREVVGRRKDGGVFPMDLAVSAISRDGNRMFVGLVRDITERKHVEQMKTEFVSTVSHELRTPLTSIAGALGLLMGGAMGELSPPVKSLVDIAHKNSQRLSHLINDLLDMEKIAAGKMHFDLQRVALLPLLHQALESNKAYGDLRQVRFVLTTTLEAIDVFVDNQRLQQVLANFLSNAAKYSPEGGQVEVVVQPRESRVRVVVRDSGPGIPQAFRDRIFQKFAQADSSDTRQKGGTGLGLAISRELAERMGGDVGFDSVEGEGASFWIELPVLWGDADSVAPSANDRGANASAPRILVVEDDVDIAGLLALMLSRAGYRTAIAYSGEQALTMLADGDFAAMTLDLLLPGMSGLEVINRLHLDPITVDFPIIVVSATVEDGKLAIDGDFSAVEWLPKPLDEKRLLSSFARVLPRDQSGPAHVLHVEDDVDLYCVIRAMAGASFDIEHAATLAEARAKLSTGSYDLVLLDLSLPDGSGWDLLPLIGELVPPPRVVVLSGAELSREESKKVDAALLKSRVSPLVLLEALNSRLKKPRRNPSERT